MPVGLLNQEAITVERASALASENVRRRQYPFEFGGVCCPVWITDPGLQTEVDERVYAAVR